MQFWNIMALPLSDKTTQTVGEYFTEWINELVRKGDYGCLVGLDVDMAFKVPDHEITQEQLINCLEITHCHFITVS